MREQINEALTAAIKAQDKRRMSTLRLVQAAIKDRDIASRSRDGDDATGGVTEAEVRDILAKMVKQRAESAETYEEAGRLDLAEQEREEGEIIKSFLPAQLSEDEVRGACEDCVSTVGAEGLKDMGRVMGALKQRYAGQMDFGKASGIVKELLS